MQYELLYDGNRGNGEIDHHHIVCLQSALKQSDSAQHNVKRLRPYSQVAIPGNAEKR
jgi:hypothetical protein